MEKAALAALALLPAIACSRARPLEDDVQSRVSWQEEVAPLFAARCTACHSGAAAAAGYDATTYATAIRAASAGDKTSKLLTMLDPSIADPIHAALGDVFPTARAWVVDGRLSFFRSGIHQGGILNPADPREFHGAVLRAQKWSFANCQGCHGQDFAGGKAGVSCLDCHSAGPTSCTTCHGQPPPTGSHAAHAGGANLGQKLDCGECHQKPQRWDDAGHLLAADGSLKSRGAVSFGALAGPAAAWDPGALSCAVSCHGTARPHWGGGPAEASCSSCHGLPPASHVSDRSCNACHGAVTAADNTILTPALHITGKVRLGDGSGTCAACHGSAGSNAPASGAHQAHLQARHGLSAPIECESCHAVPQAFGDPGHVDHAGPALVAFSRLAVADNAAPSYSRETGGCSATYCHGGGDALKKDLTAGLSRTPTWSGTLGSSCGTCHGAPPKDSVHWATLQLGDCNKCHADTVDERGGLIAGGKHLNGVVDVRAP